MFGIYVELAHGGLVAMFLLCGKILGDYGVDDFAEAQVQIEVTLTRSGLYGN